MSQSIMKADFGPVMAGLKGFPATPDQLIPLLQFVQGELGYLAPEAIAGVAEYLRLPLSHVYGVATFYAQFRFRPLGKNRLTVCRGTACHVRGSARLVEEVEKILGIRAGETTSDMMFSLETVACLGSCALAPAVVVNDKVHGKVSAKKIHRIIEELRGEVAPAEAADEASDPTTAAPPPPKPAAAPKAAEPAPAIEASAPVSALPAPAAKKAGAKKAGAKKPAAAKPMKAKSAPARPAAKKAKAKPAKKAKGAKKKSTPAQPPAKTSARPAKKSAAKKTKPARPTKATKKPAAHKSSKRRLGR